MAEGDEAPEDDTTEAKTEEEAEETRSYVLGADQIRARAEERRFQRNWWAVASAILALLLLFVGSCSVLQTAKYSRENRDLRDAVAHPTAKVTITAKPKNPHPTATVTIIADSDATTVNEPTTDATSADTGYRRPKKPKGKLFYRTTFSTCSILNVVYAHGVGAEGAVEQPAAGEDRVDNWTVDTSSYWRNSSLDDDKDGVACERGTR